MRIQKKVDLSRYATFKIGGKASFFVEVSNILELKEALSFARRKRAPVFVLGGGSNVLFPDKIFNALVLKISIKGLSFDGNQIWAGAGLDWDSFVKKTLDKKLYGLENLSGIPGTVGAVPIQNVGAYGREVSEFIKKVEALDKRSLGIKVFSNKECQFGYRESFFKTTKGKNFIITRVLFSLNKKAKVNIQYKDLKNYFGKKKPNAIEVRKGVLKIRAKKFPNLKKYGTAGSFFKNPIISQRRYKNLLKKYPDLPGFADKSGRIKVSLAFILDKLLGLKGSRLGYCGLYKNQPLVFVNLGGAKQKDILKLKKEIEKKVLEKTKIKIEPEINIIEN